MSVGLVCGSEPFAGLPTNPAQILLRYLEGETVAGIEIVTRTSPVDFAALPGVLRGHVAELRPAFVLALGLALGSPTVRVEKMAINAADFAIADATGARPTGGRRFDPQGPDGRMATWDAEAVVTAIREAGVPARASYSAGTHLCNLSLYTLLGALEAGGLASPCGFLHLPYLPEQVLWLMAERGGEGDRAPTTPTDLPSMSLDLQLVAVRAAVATIAGQAATQSGERRSL